LHPIDDTAPCHRHHPVQRHQTARQPTAARQRPEEIHGRRRRDEAVRRESIVCYQKPDIEFMSSFFRLPRVVEPYSADYVEQSIHLQPIFLPEAAKSASHMGHVELCDAEKHLVDGLSESISTRYTAVNSAHK
jgi:hypothetical protein